MRVAFVCAGNNFTPSMLYKDNYFIKSSVEHGYETLVIASQYTYKDGVRTKVPIGSSDVNGYRLIRLAYKRVLGSEFLTEKIRNVVGLNEELILFKPDFIFYNCPQIFNIKDVPSLKKNLPETKIVLDFSTKYINSARNVLSKYILHRLLYRSWLCRAQPAVDCITYVSPESLDFIKNEYKLDEKNMVEVGLPAEVLSSEEIKRNRHEIRKEYDVEEGDILFVHTGKMGKLKRTIELLHIFSEQKCPNYKMIIAGSLEDDIKCDVMKLIMMDERVQYIGFVTGEYLTKLLCASDMYLQPGTISQTSQTAICCGSPIMFMKCPTNELLFNNNGFLLDDIDQMDFVFKTISENPEQLESMRENSKVLAAEKLDYNKLFMDTLKFAGVKL